MYAVTIVVGFMLNAILYTPLYTTIHGNNMFLKWIFTLRHS